MKIVCQIEFVGLSPAERYSLSQKPFRKRKRRQERMKDGMENLGKGEMETMKSMRDIKERGDCMCMSA